MSTPLNETHTLLLKNLLIRAHCNYELAFEEAIPDALVSYLAAHGTMPSDAAILNHLGLMSFDKFSAVTEMSIALRRFRKTCFEIVLESLTSSPLEKAVALMGHSHFFPTTALACLAELAKLQNIDIQMLNDTFREYPGIEVPKELNVQTCASCFMEGQILESEHNYPEALQQYEKAIQAPSRPTLRMSPLLRKLRLFVFQKQHQQVIQTCDQGLDLCPELSHVWLAQKNQALLLMGQYTDALAICDEILKHHPRHFQTLYHKACLFLLLGQFEDAIQVFGNLLDLSKVALWLPSIELLNTCTLLQASLLIQLKRHREALAIFEPIYRIYRASGHIPTLSALATERDKLMLMRDDLSISQHLLEIESTSIFDEIKKAHPSFLLPEEAACFCSCLMLNQLSNPEDIQSLTYTPFVTPDEYALSPYDEFKIHYGKTLYRSGLSTVYRGEHRGTPIVFKTLALHAFTQIWMGGLLEEGQLHEEMSHPNIVRLHALYLEIERGIYGLVIEFAPLGPLHNLLHNSPELPWTIRLSMMLDIIAGLNYLHMRGIIHRDIKSPNLFVFDGYRIKIGDLGLACLLKPGTDHVIEHGGTVPWKSPEMLAEQRCSTQSDMFAYGGVLCELMSFTRLDLLPREKWLQMHDGCSLAIHELATECLNPLPNLRPTADTVYLRVRTAQQYPRFFSATPKAAVAPVTPEETPTPSASGNPLSNIMDKARQFLKFPR
jgi:tetratricopeptide (TPR) repeat protein